MFKILYINVPFNESLAQMPRYAKFLKELLMNKRKLEEVSIATLSEECSVIITNKLPKKEKDLGDLSSLALLEVLYMKRHLLILGQS